MGAFVGAVTSPFLRRRKGRIGKLLFVEKTAPPFNSNGYIHASANEIGNIILTKGGAGSNLDQYHRSTDQVESWITEDASPDPSVRLYKHEPVPLTGNFLIGAPYLGGNSPLLWETNLLGADIQPRFTQVNTNQLAGACWTIDGAWFCAYGNDNITAGTARVMVGQLAAGPFTQLPQSVTPLSGGFYIGIAIKDDDSLTEALFLLAGPDHFKQLRLRHGIWTSKDITNPAASRIYGICQYQNTIIACGANSRILRSTDYGETFSIIANPTVGSNFVAWRNYGKFFVGSDGAIQLFESKYGITWVASPNQPEANQDINAACNILQSSFIFCANLPGLTSKAYRFRQPMEI